MQNQRDLMGSSEDETIERGVAPVAQPYQGAPQQGAGGSLDLWDLGQSPTAPTASSYADTKALGTASWDQNTFAAEPVTGGGRSSSALMPLIGLAVFLAFITVFLVMNYQRPEGFASELLKMVGWSQEPTPQQTATSDLPQPHQVVVQKSPRVATVVSGNPYWSLENPRPVASGSLKRRWSAQEQEHYTEKLNNAYSFQQWDAVRQIREAKLRGSEELLYRALSAKKFWTRIEAALALVEFGQPINEADFERVIAGVRPSLIANYFQRFGRNASASELYMARLAIRMLDERGRLAAMNVIQQNPDSHTELYLVAASMDPGSTVQMWAEQEIQRRPPSQQRLAHLHRVIDGFERFSSETVMSIRQKDVSGYQEEVEVAVMPAETQENTIELYDAIGSESDQSVTADGFDALEAVEI